MKNYKYFTENRTRDLPACSAVPQPTALPRTLVEREQIVKLGLQISFVSVSCYSVNLKVQIIRLNTTPTCLG